MISEIDANNIIEYFSHKMQIPQELIEATRTAPYMFFYIVKRTGAIRIRSTDVCEALRESISVVLVENLGDGGFICNAMHRGPFDPRIEELKGALDRCLIGL